MLTENGKKLILTGDLDNPVNEMSKKEQSVELISTVNVPRHEYALLVAAKAKLDMVEKVVNKMESYAVKDVLKLLLMEEVTHE